MRTHITALALTAAALVTATAAADVTLPRLIGSGMVLQQNQPIEVWGWADPGEAVTVTLGDESHAATADADGDWSVTLAPRQAGGPHAITVSGDNTIRLTDVLFGEVWVCSGQSNMEWPLRATSHAKEDIAASTDSQLRVFELQRHVSRAPLDDAIGGQWAHASPESTPEFTAVGYLFGKQLRETLDVPVGLIQTAWGGTRAEAWASRESLDGGSESIAQLLGHWQMTEDAPAARVGSNNVSINPDPPLPGKPLTIRYDASESPLAGSDTVLLHYGFNTWQNVIEPDPEMTKSAGDTFEITVNIPQNAASIDMVFQDGAGEWDNNHAADWHFVSDREAPITTPHRPTVLYNAMIHPVTRTRIAGSIWYQGESNAGRAEQYRELFPLMIESWRTAFDDPDMPFGFVQLANFMRPVEAPAESAWAELRDAQLATLELPHTGMACIIDIGAADDIHPRNKRDVGSRLARWALHDVYGQSDITPSGPTPAGQIIDGGSILIPFENAEGLTTTDGSAPTAFSIAGDDKVFYWAEATINGNAITLHSAAVPSPVAVRYAWADNPAVNLVNSDNLPATPFRTDDWAGVTSGRSTP